MAVPSLAELIEELSQGPLLSPERRQELILMRLSFTEVRALASEMVKRGWLTPYQINQLAQGRGRELVLGPYILLERLGEGGMGQVFKARHSFLNRHVALKLIGKEHLTTSGAAERFLQEMQLVAQFDHPHIVRAFDAGREGERLFLAMELIEGPTLTQLVKQRGPLPVPQACACIRQAALGLQYASDRGLVHRDIKPSNLMLATSAGGPALVKLLDLGLARMQGNDPSRDLTQPGTLMGTLDYLAPEQALDPHRVDVRADIYSLGCTFFFLLTGRPPFEGTTEAQKLLQHQQQEPPAVESLRPEVPAAVSAILRSMLSKRPEHRLQTPAQVADALQPYVGTDELRGSALIPGINLDGTSPGTARSAPSERGRSLMTDATILPGTAGSAAPALSAAVDGRTEVSSSGLDEANTGQRRRIAIFADVGALLLLLTGLYFLYRTFVGPK